LENDPRMANLTYGLPARHRKRYEEHIAGRRDTNEPRYGKRFHESEDTNSPLPLCKQQYTYPLTGEKVSCSSLSYLQKAPKKGTSKYFWEYVMGKQESGYYGQLRFDLDWFMQLPTELVMRFEMRFFVGGGLFVHLKSATFEIAAAYAYMQAVIDAELDECAQFEAGLYYSYIMHQYFWGIKLSKSCRKIETTCKPTQTPDEKLNRVVFMRYTFYETNPCIRFQVGPVPMSICIGVYGEMGLYWAIELIYAQGQGGLALLGYCGPFAALILRAELGIDLFLVSFGIGIEVTIIEVRLPVVMHYNLMTRDVCMYIGLRLSALGGKFILWVKVGIKIGPLKLQKTFETPVIKWKGPVWEIPIYERNCCIFCPAPCNSNAYCHYRFGECICNPGWGGLACEIECNKDCVDMELTNNRVVCIDTGEEYRHGYTDNCTCWYGYMGWNCQDQCPGMPDASYRGHPCWDHGNCLPTANCACYYDYSRNDCNKTCEITGTPPEHLIGLSDGERCYGNGTCMYRPVKDEAECVCFKGYMGDKCDKSCLPLVNGAPCGNRGLCYLEDPNDLYGRCQCELGFWGEYCDTLDYDASGRAVKFEGNGYIGTCFCLFVPCVGTRLCILCRRFPR